VSPSGFASPIELVEVIFPPGESVAFENVMRNMVTHQQIWVLEGEIEVTVGDDRHELAAGDCLAHMLDRPVAYRNRTRKAARYAVILVSGPAPKP